MILSTSLVYKKNNNSAFSLIELLVVITIITIILTVVISRQSTFFNRAKIDDKVYDLVLALRKAQVYTLGVREFECVSNGSKTFNASYGVYLDSSSANQFIFFVDANKDGIYNDISLACYTEITAMTAPGIDRICRVPDSGSAECYPGPSALRKVSITYGRPDPKPIIKFTNSANNEIVGFANNSFRVYFKYPNQNGEVELTVNNTGYVGLRYVP